MACLIKDVDGKTIVQVKVPVCITIQMDEADAKDMTQDELAGLVDEVIDQVERQCGVLDVEFCPRRWMMRIPFRFSVARSWDELPIDEMEINYSEDGYFEKRGDDEYEDDSSR
jgi:hypothetical protein